nr:hypothetical protein CFP56_18187 [Quercus suber]
MVDGEVLPATDRAKWDDDTLLLNMKREAIMGYQCSIVIEERFLVVKTKAKELHADNEDLLKKILDVMNKVSEFEKLRAEAEENTKAIAERKEAFEKVLEKMKKALVEKEVEMKVQQNLQTFFSKGRFVALDKMQVEPSSSFRQESSIPIPEELIIIPNLEIQGIINDESPVREVEGPGPTVGSGGDVTTPAAAPTTEEPFHA